MKTSTTSKIRGWTVVGLMLAIIAAVFYMPTASAHGEKSQAPFLRMRTIHWYDLTWSTDKLKVNEEMTVSGKFHVFEDWPEAVADPDTAFLNIGIPGPVMVRTQSYIGGVPVPRSVGLRRGETYDFKVVLKARRPGRWHVHTMMNVFSGGPLIGPGKWVEIEGSMADFKSEVQTLTGKTVDLETYGIGGVVGWHLLWAIVAIAWLWWWVRRPTFLPRFARVDAGNEEGLVTELDKKVAIGFAAATVLIMIYGYTSANANFPITVPLQAGLLGEMPSIPIEKQVGVVVNRATYRVPGRSLALELTVTNNAEQAIELGEFEVASVRFLNPAVVEDNTGYPENLLADEGLALADEKPIEPGETRTLRVTATDAAWETERLSDVIYDPDSRFAGLLFFFDSGGKKHVVSIKGPLIPTFG
jgi:methane monooxygenase/ammonia monooxygenase, subunit B